MPKFKIEGRTASYVEAGRGETLALVHSSGCSSAQWRATAAAFADRFHVVAPDLHGYGRTAPWPGGRAITLSDEAALVAGALAETAGPVHLVGHSFGGAVALRFALDYPQRVASLMLIEPVAFFLLRDGDARHRPLCQEVDAVADAVTESAARGADWEGMERFVDYWNGDGAFDSLSFEQRCGLVRHNRAVALNFAAVAAEVTAARTFSQIRVPTLVMRGQRSPQPTRRVAEILTSLLPMAALMTVSGAGHMLPLSHRALMERTLVDHIANRSCPCRKAA